VHRLLLSTQVNQRLKPGRLVKKDVSLEKVRNSVLDLIGGELFGRHLKDRIHFLESQTLGFRDPEDDHDQGEDIETGLKGQRLRISNLKTPSGRQRRTHVETKGSGRSHNLQHSRERQRENKGPSETDGCRRTARTRQDQSPVGSLYRTLDDLPTEKPIPISLCARGNTSAE